MPEMQDRHLPLAILVVDDEANIRRTLSLCLEGWGHAVAAVGNFDDALAEASRRSFDLAFVDLRLGTKNGLELIPALLRESPWLKIVVITAYASVDTAVEAIRRGALDYIPKPFSPVEVEIAVKKVSEVRRLEQRVAALQEALGRSGPDSIFESQSPSVLRAFGLAREVTAADTTILLAGESGTGKSVLARAIHAWSPRAARPFGVVSCASLSLELLESELFGHARGAFTGAVKETAGRIAACEGGTLFLDEVGDLPLAIQPKLLRFLEEREYERVGEATTRRADVRVIAATHVDLLQAVREGRFREDLLYRLNVFPIELPALRERPEDLLPLAERYLAFFGQTNHKHLLGFTPEAEEALRRHTWPGNLRELRNVVERAAILCKQERVGIELLPGSPAGTAPPEMGKRLTLEEIEERHIRCVLAETRSLQEAADVLGIDPATLWRKRKQYGI